MTIDSYIKKLINSGVELLCDVRKNPFSHKYGFSKNELSNSLKISGIEYLHIPDLGIVSDRRKNLNSDADYRVLFDQYRQDTLPKQRQNLGMLLDLINEKTKIAITCFEKMPKHCHRGCISEWILSNNDFNCKVVDL